MPTDRAGDPWSDRTYNGFAGSPPPPPEPRRAVRLPAMTGRNLAIGAGAAVAFGLLFGLWARPNFAKDPNEAAERTATPVPIQVDRPPPPEPMRSDGKLEVLSPDQVAAARMSAPSAAPPPAAYVPAAPPALPPVETEAPQPAPRQAPPLAVAPPAPRVAQAPPAPQPASRTGFDCSGARSPAEAMVCADPELAAADRELGRAYRRAMQSGAVPPAVLRSDQRDWLNIREDAARHSRRAVMSVYQQRIDELNSAVDDGGDGPGF